MLTAFTGASSERCPGIGFLSRGDREIGVLRNVEPPTRPRLECLRETGLILRCDRKVGNPFQTKQGSRPSRPDQEGRKGSEEGVPENLRVPLEGDRDFGELCGSHQGCQVPFRPPIPNVGLLLRRCSGKGLHLAMTGEPRGLSRVTAGFSSYDGEFRMPLVLAQASPIFHSSCEGKLGIDRKSTRLNSSHHRISYAVFCLKKKTQCPSKFYHIFNLTASIRITPKLHVI